MERQAVAVWTAEQTAAFLHAIRDHGLYAAYHLIALRRLRRSEAAGLRWADVDLEPTTTTGGAATNRGAAPAARSRTCSDLNAASSSVPTAEPPHSADWGRQDPAHA